MNRNFKLLCSSMLLSVFVFFLNVNLKAASEAASQTDIKLDAASVTSLDAAEDREINTYELMIVALEMQIAQLRGRLDAVASIGSDLEGIGDIEKEKTALEAMLRTHSAESQPEKSAMVLESARLDQKLVQSKCRILESKMQGIEETLLLLKKESAEAEKERNENDKLILDHKKRLQSLEDISASSTSLIADKKKLLEKVLTAREEYLHELHRLTAVIDNRTAILEKRKEAIKALISLYNTFDEQLGLVIRRHEENLRKLTAANAAASAKEAADTARRSMEEVDKKLQEIDKKLSEKATLNASDISAKILLVAEREMLLSQKDSLNEQIRYHELRARIAQDSATIEEMEQRAALPETASTSILTLWRSEWHPKFNAMISAYRHEKELAAKRIELLKATRKLVETALLEAGKAKDGRSEATVRDESKLCKQQLNYIDAAIKALSAQTELYDSMLDRLSNARKTIRSILESELQKHLFARTVFNPQGNWLRETARYFEAIPASLAIRLKNALAAMNLGLFLEILLTLAICFGFAHVIHNLRLSAESESKVMSLKMWLRQTAYWLAADIALITFAKQLEPLMPLFFPPAAFLTAWILYSFVRSLLLNRLHENHIIRVALLETALIAAIGIPSVVSMRKFGMPQEFIFLVAWIFKLWLIRPTIRFIRGAAAFNGLLQAFFDFKHDSRLLKFSVFAYKLIAVINLVCILVALYGYDNLALFIFIRNMEVFVIVLMIAVGRPIADRFAYRLFDKQFGIASQYVDPERGQFFLFVTRKLLRFTVYLLAAMFAAYMSGISTRSSAVRFLVSWVQNQSDFLLPRLGRIFIIVIVIVLVLEFLKTVGESIIEYVKSEDRSSPTEENERRISTLVQIVNTSAKVVLFCIGGIMILRELGMDITPLLTGAGIVGIAIGIGSQSLVKDFFGGFFILVENQFRVGDVIEIAGKSGTVEKINLKTTVLRSVDGSVYIIPNGEITSVKNMTYSWSRALLDISVDYDSDIDKVMEVLRKVGDEIASDPKYGTSVWGRPEVLGVESFGESSMVMRMIIKTKPLTQWDIARIFRKRIKEAFDAEGIIIPYPNRVVTLHMDEEMKKMLENIAVKS